MVPKRARGWSVRQRAMMNARPSAILDGPRVTAISLFDGALDAICHRCHYSPPSGLPLLLMTPYAGASPPAPTAEYMPQEIPRDAGHDIISTGYRASMTATTLPAYQYLKRDDRELSATMH